MKQLFISILVLIYFTVNTGFAVNLHYCMDKIASVELGGEKHDLCNKCGMPVQDKEGCCRDEVKVFKLSQDVLPVHTLAPGFLELPVIVTETHYHIAPLISYSVETAYQAHAPPLIDKQDTYLKNCVFRI